MKRILAFEGDQELAAELKSYFWRHGCSLDVVDGVDDGIEKAIAERPDLILLTIELPRTNGFSVCNRLKRNKTLKSIPLIITSSECSDETFQEHQKMQTCAEDYIHKPFDLRVLFQKVSALLNLEEERARGAGTRALDVTTPHSDNDAQGRGVPITAIFHSLDGAFESIQAGRLANKPVSTPLPEPLSPSPPSPGKSYSPPSPPSPLPESGPPAVKPSLSREQCMIGLWSPDACARGQCFSFPLIEEGEVMVTVGRDSSRNIVIEDPGVSEAHFQLEINVSGVSLRDLGSGNGTFVNGELVSYLQLRGGETIRAGTTTFLFLRGLDLDAQFENVIRELSEVDAQTRTMSNPALRELLEVEIALADQESIPLTLAAVGVDEIYKIAYRYGDLVAERVIQETASMLKTKAPSCVVGRDFGAGFLVVMPGSTERVGAALAEGWRFEASVSEFLIEHHTVRNTVSVGVVRWKSEWSTTDLVRRAYKLLWEALHTGGDTVLTHKGHVVKP